MITQLLIRWLEFNKRGVQGSNPDPAYNNVCSYQLSYAYKDDIFFLLRG